MLLLLLSFVAAISTVTATATHLYVSSFTGAITTLELSRENGYSLKAVAVDHSAPLNTTWLLLNKPKGLLYSLEEGSDGHQIGFLATYKTSASGVLTQINRQSTVGGPVHQALYNSGKAMAVPH
jgi:6-phosphogluconolactonase (cycloisomerase 2 family)